MASPAEVDKDAQIAEKPLAVRTPSSIPFKLKMMAAINRLTFSIMHRKDGTVNRTIAKFLDQKAAAKSKPVDGIVTEDIIIDKEANIFYRIFSHSAQEEGRKFPLIVYLHGGGFTTFGADSKTFDQICRTVAKICNATVISVNYRLAPEFPYPTAYEDCYQALEWLRSESNILPGADINQCFLMGDSAGGNIAHHLMIKAAQNDLSPVQIKGVVMLSPFFGGATRSPTETRMPDAPLLTLKLTDIFWKAFLPAGSDRDHPACNVIGKNAEDFSSLSLPPVFITIGSLDILQDWEIQYAEKLKEMGCQVEVKHTEHIHAEYMLEPVLIEILQVMVKDFLTPLLS